MKKTAVMVAVGVVVCAGAYLWMTREGDAPVEKPIATAEINTMRSARKKELAQPVRQAALQTIANQATADEPSEKSKVKFSATLLAKMNPAFQKANPGVDFSKLKAGDAAWAALKVPRETELMLLQDPNCGRSSALTFGRVAPPSMGESFETLPSPKFVSVRTEEDQTLGELGQKADKETCSIGVFANGPIDAVRISATKDIQKRLAETPVENLKVFDFKEAYKEGQQLVSQSIYEGRPKAIQVYSAGSTADRFGVNADGLEPAAPIPVASLANGAARMYALPLPITGSPSQQISDTNNAVIAAIAHGADAILLPAVEPEIFAAIAGIAKEHHVKVYMVPRDTPDLPTALVDQPRLPNSDSTAR